MRNWRTDGNVTFLSGISFLWQNGMLWVQTLYISSLFYAVYWCSKRFQNFLFWYFSWLCDTRYTWVWGGHINIGILFLQILSSLFLSLSLSLPQVCSVMMVMVFSRAGGGGTIPVRNIILQRFKAEIWSSGRIPLTHWRGTSHPRLVVLWYLFSDFKLN